MSGTQDYIQLDLLGLIAAGFTNVKFQMGSTEGGAYSSAGVSGSAHAPPMRLWWVAMEPLTWPMNLSARNHYLGFLRDQGERTAGPTSAFRSTQCSGALIVRPTAGRHARSCGRLFCQTVGNAKGLARDKIEATILEGRSLFNMRVAIVSDIHGNRRAFEAVLSDLRLVSPDMIVHGGDLSAGGTRPAEIIDQIRQLGWPGVRGNTDEMLWDPQRLTEYAAAQPKLTPILSRVAETIPPTRAILGEERLRWLASLPPGHVHESFTLVHASPKDLWRAPAPNASDEELRTTYASLAAQVVVYGHIHCPYIRKLRGTTVVNTGSVSQSYDGDRRASYLVIEGESLTIRRVEYDVEAEANELLNCGLPHAGWLSRILLAGKYCPPD
jgi:predicted phosphodiesterase